MPQRTTCFGISIILATALGICDAQTLSVLNTLNVGEWMRRRFRCSERGCLEVRLLRIDDTALYGDG